MSTAVQIPQPASESPAPTAPPEPAADRAIEPGGGVRAWAGFTLILVMFVPALVWRASQEQRLWGDEIYSLMLTHRPLAELIDLTAVDAHPPGYYLILKAWNKLARVAGAEPGLVWGRLPGVLGWVWLVGVAWFGGRRVFGRRAGTVMAWAVASSAQLAHGAVDMRSYAVAAPALFTCWMALWLIEDERRGARPRGRAITALWIAYGLCAALAMWTHLLSGLVLAALGLCWIGLGCRRAPRPRAWWLGGALAQAGALALFVPWMIHVAEQVRYVHAFTHAWMTPPSFENLIRVFFFWYPFGQLLTSPWAIGAETMWVAIGALTLLVPAVALLRAYRRPAVTRAVPGAWVWPALTASGLGAALIFTLFIWGLARLKIIEVFHGPRYPVLAVACWAMGLVGLAGWATVRAGWPGRRVVALLAPWIVAGLVGQSYESKLDVGSTMPQLRPLQANLPPGEPLYVMPPELIPCVRETWGAWPLRRIEELLTLPPDTDHATVLELIDWQAIRTERDTVVKNLLKPGVIAQRVESRPFFHRLEGIDHARLAEEAKLGLSASKNQAPPDALLWLHPRELRRRDGWHAMDIDAQRGGLCWSSRPETRLRFKGTLAPGRYRLRLSGHRDPFPMPETTLTARVAGQPAPAASCQVAEGWFNIELPLRIEHAAGSPVVIELTHPIQRPDRALDFTADTRPLGIMLYQAWVTAEPGEGT